LGENVKRYSMVDGYISDDDVDDDEEGDERRVREADGGRVY
jgi:hypothetical protein